MKTCRTRRLISARVGTGIRYRAGLCGFTLVELLVVVAIILILMSLLFPVIAKAKRKARRNAAQAEVRNIELAWRNYLQDYVRPPTNTPDDVGIPYFLIERRKVPIKGAIADVLKGENVQGDNPDHKRYMRFQFLNADGDPVNPWNSVRQYQQDVDSLRYYVKFDFDFDGKIRRGQMGEPHDPPNDEVATDVIVWTHNPSLPLNDPNRIIGSWK